MPPAAENSNAANALVAALRGRVSGLPPEASEAAAALSKYASDIEHRESSDEALAKFSDFAMHHKGLRDLVVPGIDEREWSSFVEEVRGLSSAALRASDMEKTLLGRIHALLHSRGT